MAMEFEIMEVVQQITKTKNLDLDYVLETVAEGLMVAARKKWGEEVDNVRVDIDRAEGDVYMVAVKTVVAEIKDDQHEISLPEAKEIDKESELGDEMEIEIPFEEFGRNAIAATKQLLVQRIREKERELVYEEYKDRVGEVVTCIVQHVDKGALIVNLGRGEGVIPHKEQIPRERFRQGDRLRAYIMEVERSQKGPQVVLSRAHPGLVLRLFELEIPEIFEKVIEIRGVARAPGERTKIAVSSIDDRVDPVGACVGVKGVRVQSIVREMAGERIDIVAWDNDAESFVKRALAPTDVLNVLTNEDAKSMMVVVEDDKLALAIGRNGQNARLAAKLTGYKITIRSESEYRVQRRDILLKQREIDEIAELSDSVREKLWDGGVRTVGGLLDLSIDELTEINGIGPKTAEKAQAAAAEFLEAERQRTAEAEAAPTEHDVFAYAADEVPESPADDEESEEEPEDDKSNAPEAAEEEPQTQQ